MLDSATCGVLDGTTYTLADDVLVETCSSAHRQSTAGRSTRYDAPSAGTLTVNLEDPEREPTRRTPPARGMAPSRPAGRSRSPRGGRRGGTVVDVPCGSGYADDIVGDYRAASAARPSPPSTSSASLNFTVSDSASNRPAESCADRIRYLVGLIGFPVAEGFADTGRTVIAMDLEGKNVLTILRGIEPPTKAGSSSTLRLVVPHQQPHRHDADHHRHQHARL